MASELKRSLKLAQGTRLPSHCTVCAGDLDPEEHGASDRQAGRRGWTPGRVGGSTCSAVVLPHQHSHTLAYTATSNSCTSPRRTECSKNARRTARSRARRTNSSRHRRPGTLCSSLFVLAVCSTAVVSCHLPSVLVNCERSWTIYSLFGF